jgi:hypothetical protein
LSFVAIGGVLHAAGPLPGSPIRRAARRRCARGTTTAWSSVVLLGYSIALFASL